MYKPPFTISSKAINLIALISARLERYAIRMEQADSLRLRKVNRIKTIHSSLAIEGNKLSEGEVFAILEGKRVIAHQKEIQEVKNAIKTYELYPTLNPYSVKDILKAHHTMMVGLVDEAGTFRKGGVGVFDGEKAIHVAPPANRVKHLMNDLFYWLEHSEDHLLIRSCVFHYEFEFIHPFADGNGRIGRLWQSLILGKFNPLFEYLPVENMVYANQKAYYNAISQSSIIGDSQPFIDFMLQEILNALEEYKEKPVDEIATRYNLSDNAIKMLSLIRADRYITAKELAEELGISQRQVERLLANLKKQGIIERIGANRNGYWEITK
ncbi:MAG: Fic family protein [Fermentimonas sp.]|jgi:Fic family protein